MSTSTDKPRTSDECQREIKEIMLQAEELASKKRKLNEEMRIIEEQEKLEAEKKRLRVRNEKLKCTQDDEDFENYSNLFFKYNGYRPDPVSPAFTDSPQGSKRMKYNQDVMKKIAQLESDPLGD